MVAHSESVSIPLAYWLLYDTRRSVDDQWISVAAK